MSYKYLNIRFDSKYSIETDTKELLDFIKRIPEVKQTDKVQFENKTNFPWGVISLIKCDQRGCFSIDKGQYFEMVNLVELLFSDNQESLTHYQKIGTEIANQLNWELIDDDTDEILMKRK